MKSGTLRLLSDVCFPYISENVTLVFNVKPGIYLKCEKLKDENCYQGIYTRHKFKPW